MNDLLNPYIAGAPVTESSMFFGREEVFGWIERSLAGKFVDHILVLHGQRRVGKTSVLKQIPNFLGDKYIQVFFDLQGRTNTTLDRFLWWLAREIARTLTREHGFETPRPDRQAFAENTDHLIDEFFPALQPALGEQVLLLTFDEFDTLAREDIQETLAKPLIAYLRRLMDLEGLNFIFSIGSSGNKLENMQASYTDFFKSALYRKISFLDQRSCRHLITKPVEDVIAYDRRAVNRIYAITAGHPYFTQLICHELFSLCQKTGSRQIKHDDVESVMEDVIERGTVNLKFVWDEASDLEKWALASLAQQEGAISGRELVTSLRQQKVRFVESDLNSALIHLRDKDVLTQDNRFVIYLMRLWLRQNRPLDRVREELAEINPIANRLLEIGDEYRSRDHLDKALDSYRDALEASPGYLKAQLRIASTLFESGTYQEAVIAFEEALDIDPADVAAQTGLSDSLLAWGDQALDLGETERAIQRYQRVLTLNQAHRDARQRLASIHSQRAEEFLSAGQDDEALAAFNRALEFTPENTELAERYDQVAEQKRAKVITGWLQKADRALGRQAWEEAERFVEEALRLDPENQELQTKLSDVKDAPRQFKIQKYKRTAEQALDKDKYESAIAALEDAVALAPEDESLANWLERTRAEYLDVQLNRYRHQAERAIAAGNWEAAIAARQEAVKLSPDDSELQQELADTESAHKQAQLDVLQKQADHAIQEGKWDQAIQAYRSAKELDPNEPSWDQKIEETQAAQLQAQLDHLQVKADEAVAQEQWDSAFQAVREALKIAPEQAPWEEKLDQIESARHQAQLSALRQEAQKARSAENWDAAKDTLERYLELEPGDEEIQAEIEAIGEEKRQSQLATFKAQAETATAEHKWDDAVQAWEGYLALDPEDRSEIEASRQHARKYAQISSDYAEAQEALRHKNFARAVKLLQGIIAQDPTYKSTSRLLVEAVETKEKIPVWRTPWVYGAVGAVIFIVLLVIFGPRAMQAFSLRVPTDVSANISSTTRTPVQGDAPTLTLSPTSLPTTSVVAENQLETPASPEATTSPEATIVPLIATQYARLTAAAQTQADKLIFQTNLAEEEITSISWSPSGDRFAVASADGQGVRIVDGQSGELLSHWTDHATDVVIWSPNGDNIAAGNDDGVIVVFDTQSGEILDEIDTGMSDITCMDWSNDGDQLAAGDDEGYLSIWDTTTLPFSSVLGSSRAIVDVRDIEDDLALGNIISLSFPSSPGEDRLLVVGQDSRHDYDHVFSLSTTTYEWSAYSPSRPDQPADIFTLSNAIWMPGGTYSAFGQKASLGILTSPLLIVKSSSGMTKARGHGHGAKIIFVAWAPDGKAIASTDQKGSVRIWTEFNAPGEMIEIEGSDRFSLDNPGQRLAWSPDGNILLASDSEGNLYAWDLSSD